MEMGNKIERLIMLNQMAGPLFRELAEDIAPRYKKGCLLITGHPDTLEKKDRIPNLEVKPAPTYTRKSYISRIVSWLNYVLFITGDVLFADRKECILLVSNPPILGIWVWFLTRINKIPYTVLVYDIHPNVLIELGAIKKSSILAKIWHALNKTVYGNSELIITIGDRMAKIIQSQLPSNAPNVVTIPPWVDTKKIKPLARKENPYASKFLHKNDLFTVLYSGNMGAAHDIGSMLEAARILRNHKHINFLFIGEGERYKDIDDFIERYDLKNTALHPFQPEEIIQYTLPLADLSLVSLDQGMEDLMVPSKSFYYLAAGSVLIAIANEKSELSDIIHSNQCGFLVPPGKPRILAETIKNLASNSYQLSIMKAQARKVAEERYSREICTLMFAEYLGQSKLL